LLLSISLYFDTVGITQAESGMSAATKKCDRTHEQFQVKMQWVESPHGSSYPVTARDH